MKHKQPSQIIYSTKEISENLHLFHKIKRNTILSQSITQSSIVQNTQSHCSLYNKTNSQKTLNDHQEIMNDFKTEITKLQMENKEIKDKYIKSLTKTAKLQRDYFPFECYSMNESDYQVLFSFKFGYLNYLFIKRTDKHYDTYYYWMKENDVRKNGIDYNELGLPGVYFDTFENFLTYHKLKEELAIAKSKLIEQEKAIIKLERIKERNNSNQQTTNTTINHNSTTYNNKSNDSLMICNQTSMVSIIIRTQSKIISRNNGFKFIVDYSFPQIQIISNNDSNGNSSGNGNGYSNGTGTNIEKLVQSWKEYEVEKPNSKEVCDRMELKQNEPPEDINIEQIPAEIQGSTSGRFINRSELYEKLTQVILTYKTQLVTKERELIEEHSSRLNDKECIIQSLKRDNDQYIIESNNQNKLIIELKDLMKIKEAEASKLLEYESQMATLRLAISSLQQANYTYLQTINQKESQINLKENKINSMKIQLKEKDNQIEDYYNIIRKLSLNMELGEKIELKEMSYSEDNIDEMI